MQKISGILAGSPRVMSVDMKEAPPVRPGAPGFGRPEGVSSLRERASAVDALRKARELQDGLAAQRTQDSGQAEIAAKMSDHFFMRNRSEANPVEPTGGDMIVAIPIEEVTVASRPAGFKNDAADALREPVMDPDALYPKGSFIDRVA